MINKIKPTFAQISLLLFFVLSVSKFTSAQNKLPDGVSIYELDNGLQVLLIENQALPMVGINTVVKVGSAYETYATSGMSHMLEHLLFNGTEKFTQRELYDATDLIGGYNNANTSEFYTNFMMVTPAENIEKGIEIQSEMLFHSLLPNEKYDKEKGIVLEELSKSLADADEQAERNIISTIFEGYPYSLPTLGTYQTIKHMKRDDVYNFYKNFYVPNNMLVSVVGNFNSKQMLKILNKYFGEIAPANYETINLEDFYFDGDVKSNTKILHRFYDGKSEKMTLFFPTYNFIDYELQNLLEISLKKHEDFLNNHLQKRFNLSFSPEFSLRVKPGISYLEVNLNIKEEQLTDAIVDSISTYINIMNLSIEFEELDKIIAKGRTSFLRNIEKPHMFGIYNAELIAQGGFESVLQKYNGESYYKAAENLNEIIFAEEPLILIQHPSNTDTEKSKSKITTKLFPKSSGHADIIARQNEQSNLLAIHYLFIHKLDYENKYGQNASFIWHDAFGQRMKSDEFQNDVARYGFVFTVNDNPFIPMDNIYLSDDFGYIRVEALGDEINSAIEFLNKQIINFVPTKDEFKTAIQNYKRSQMMKRSNPAKDNFEKLVDETIYANSKNSKITELTYNSLIEFGKRYFIPENMIISVVSKQNHDEINKLFLNFKKSTPKDFISEPIQKTFFKNIDKPIENIISAKTKRAYLYYAFQKSIQESEKSALLALSLILNDKIVFDIREKQGLAYNMGAGIKVLDDKAMFYINMGSQNQNVDVLLKQFPEKFTEAYLGEITQDELQKRVNMYLGRMMFRRLSSINQGFYLGTSYLYSNDFEKDAKVLEELKNVKLAEVKKVAEKYLSPKNEITIVIKGEE